MLFFCLKLRIAHIDVEGVHIRSCRFISAIELTVEQSGQRHAANTHDFHWFSPVAGKFYAVVTTGLAIGPDDQAQDDSFKAVSGEFRRFPMWSRWNSPASAAESLLRRFAGNSITEGRLDAEQLISIYACALFVWLCSSGCCPIDEHRHGSFRSLAGGSAPVVIRIGHDVLR